MNNTNKKGDNNDFEMRMAQLEAERNGIHGTGMNDNNNLNILYRFVIIEGFEPQDMGLSTFIILNCTKVV